MPLATFEDANTHLDETKISFVDDADAAPEAREADNIVRSKLGDIFPDQVAHWIDTLPDPVGDALITPNLVREAASLLMASYRYAKRYSEDELNENDYAARLEKRAMRILEDIRNGTAILWDVDYGLTTEAAYSLEQEDFYPNDTYTPESVELDIADPRLQPKRSFSMDRRF